MSKLRKTDGATYSRIDSQELLTAQVLISQSIFTVLKTGYETYTVIPYWLRVNLLKRNVRNIIPTCSVLPTVCFQLPFHIYSSINSTLVHRAELQPVWCTKQVCVLQALLYCWYCWPDRLYGWYATTHMHTSYFAGISTMQCTNQLLITNPSVRMCMYTHGTESLSHNYKHRPLQVLPHIVTFWSMDKIVKYKSWCVFTYCHAI